MSLAFYFDQNANGHVARGLRQRGVDVLTAQEDGNHQLPDDALFARAIELGRVIYTHDDDFLRLANIAAREGRSFPGIIYQRQQSVVIGREINALQTFAEDMSPDDVKDRVFYFPL